MTPYTYIFVYTPMLTAKTLMPSYSAHLISMDLLLSYINRCTAHYSSAMFCLELIKVIALAHHHFHRIPKKSLNMPKVSIPWQSKINQNWDFEYIYVEICTYVYHQQTRSQSYAFRTATFVGRYLVPRYVHKLEVFFQFFFQNALSNSWRY
jgi:hypothetical protein